VCPDVQPPPVTGFTPGAAIYLLGQAPGPREQAAGLPFVGPAGRNLFKWFASIGVEESCFRSRVHMGAVIRCFPGKTPGKQGDRRPSPLEISCCASYLETEFGLLRPRLVIPVGKMAIDRLLPAKILDDAVGRVFQLDLDGHRFDAIPLPHPSGLNRWIQKDPGKSLLGEGLQLIAAHPVWQQVFGQDPTTPPPR